MDNVKPFLGLCQQVDKLKSRNCSVNDDIDCENFLLSVNYYRLTAYFLPFKGKDDNYHGNVTLDRIKGIYDFDAKLRNALFELISDIEIYTRSTLAYYFGGKYGALGYEDRANFSNKYNFDDAEERYKKEIEKSKNVLFVKHHLQNKGGRFPIWVMCELFSFGDISRFYSGMHTADKKQYSKAYFDGTNYKVLSNYLKCCTELRNICAHHGRIYFRIFSGKPANIQPSVNNKYVRLWEYMLTLRRLYRNNRKWNEHMIEIEHIISSYSSYIDLKHLNFPTDWYDRLYIDSCTS